MSHCRRLLRSSISSSQRAYGTLSHANSLFFEGLIREANKTLHCYAIIPLSIACIISALVIIPMTMRLFTVSFKKKEEYDSYNNILDTYISRTSKCIIFKIRRRITDFGIYFVNRPIRFNRISLVDNNFILTNNGDKSIHKIVSHTGKQWINKNDQEWVKIYAALSIYIYIYVHYLSLFIINGYI